MWNVQPNEVPELYPVSLAVANQVYLTPVDLLTVNGHEADPLALEVRVHTVAPLTFIVTLAPETALPPLVTVTFSVTVEPFVTLAPFAGLLSVTDNDFAVEVVVTMTWFTCRLTGVAVT